MKRSNDELNFFDPLVWTLTMTEWDDLIAIRRSQLLRTVVNRAKNQLRIDLIDEELKTGKVIDPRDGHLERVPIVEKEIPVAWIEAKEPVYRPGPAIKERYAFERQDPVWEPWRDKAP